MGSKGPKKLDQITIKNSGTNQKSVQSVIKWNGHVVSGGCPLWDIQASQWQDISKGYALRQRLAGSSGSPPVGPSQTGISVRNNVGTISHKQYCTNVYFNNVNAKDIVTIEQFASMKQRLAKNKTMIYSIEIVWFRKVKAIYETKAIICWNRQIVYYN